MKFFLHISTFLEEVSSFPLSIFSLYFCFFFFSLQYCIGFAIYQHESTTGVKKAFLLLLAIFWNSAFSWMYFSLSPLPYTSLLSSIIYKASEEKHFALLHLIFYGVILVMLVWSLESFHHLHCLIIKYLAEVIPEGASGFLYFFSF